MERYWLLGNHNEDNKINDVADVTDCAVVGLVDEEAGGVIGWIEGSYAKKICIDLNLTERMKTLYRSEIRED